MTSHQQKPDPLCGLIVGKHWQTKYKIGCGSFGEIYLGVDVRTHEKVAIKIESKTSKYPQLIEEYNIYRKIKPGAGVPSVFYCGETDNWNCMVMELLGDSLETLYNKCNRKFTLKTITMIAIQLLHRIEHHHNSSLLHRDIKPDNFLMGLKHNSHILYLIDMGLCKRFRDEKTLQHIPYRENKKLIGTPRYASINTHIGLEQSRRDDLESIGFMLIYFLIGKLPWQGLKAKTKQEKYDKISRKKMQISIDELCKGCPEQFATFLHYSRNLRFVEKPNYKYLRGLFYDLFRKSNFVDDCIYDWMLLPQTTTKQIQQQTENENNNQLIENKVDIQNEFSNQNNNNIDQNQQNLVTTSKYRTRQSVAQNKNIIKNNDNNNKNIDDNHDDHVDDNNDDDECDDEEIDSCERNLHKNKNSNEDEEMQETTAGYLGSKKYTNSSAEQKNHYRQQQLSSSYINNNFPSSSSNNIRNVNQQQSEPEWIRHYNHQYILQQQEIMKRQQQQQQQYYYQSSNGLQTQNQLSPIHPQITYTTMQNYASKSQPNVNLSFVDLTSDQSYEGIANRPISQSVNAKDPLSLIKADLAMSAANDDRQKLLYETFDSLESERDKLRKKNAELERQLQLAHRQAAEATRQLQLYQQPDHPLNSTRKHPSRSSANVSPSPVEPVSVSQQNLDPSPRVPVTRSSTTAAKRKLQQSTDYNENNNINSTSRQPTKRRTQLNRLSLTQLANQ